MALNGVGLRHLFITGHLLNRKGTKIEAASVLKKKQYQGKTDNWDAVLCSGHA